MKKSQPPEIDESLRLIIDAYRLRKNGYVPPNISSDIDIAYAMSAGLDHHSFQELVRRFETQG